MAAEQTVAPEDRLAAARAKLDQPRAETFRFKKAGDEIAGTVVRLDVADTEYGTQRIIVIDPGDGNLRSVWLLHDALLSQMRKMKPQVGDVIAVRYLGRQQAQGSGRSYHAYTVTSDAERPQFQWDTPSARPPAGERLEKPFGSDELVEANPFDDDPPF